MLKQDYDHFVEQMKRFENTFNPTEKDIQQIVEKSPEHLAKMIDFMGNYFLCNPHRIPQFLDKLIDFLNVEEKKPS